MSESVGAISLDLVIKSQIEKQLNGIKEKISSTMTKPVEQVSKTISDTMSNAMSKVKKSTESTGNAMAKSMKESADKSKVAWEEHKNAVQGFTDDILKGIETRESKINKSISDGLSVDKAVNNAKKSIESISDVKIKTPEIKSSWGYDPDAMKFMDDYAKKINETSASAKSTMKESVQSISEEMKKELGNFEISEDPTERLKKNLELTQEKMGLLNAKWQELQTSLSQQENENGVTKITSQLNTVESQMLSLQNSADKTKAKINDSLGGGAEEGSSRFSQAFSNVGDKVKSLASGITTSLKSAVSVAGSAIKKGLGGAFKGLKSIGGKAFDGLKSKIGGFKKSIDSTTKPISRLSSSLKSAAKRVFLMSAAYAVFKGLKSAISEACNSNDQFASSLNEIKANLQIAFVPITQAIMPALNILMQGVASATKVIATFTSELFGSTYKKSLDTVKKIKEVGKEAKKNSTYLASFDEMNVAQDSSSDSSSSSDSGGVDYSAINGDNVKLPDWAKQMKDAIKSGDWAGIGSLLAEKINKCFNIDWTSIQSKVNGALKGLADGLNGFIHKFDWGGLGDTFAGGVNTIFGGAYTFMTTFDWSGLGKGIAKSLNNVITKTDWKLIGKTLASKWNALINTLFAFVTNFNWKKFGKSIGDSVNAWFNEIDWAKLGKTLSESVKGVLDSIINFFQTVDWQGIGEKLWTFIKNIDWGGIASRLFEAIGSSIGAAVSLLWGFIKDAVFSIRDYFKDKIQECGGSIIQGLFKGLGDAFESVGTWIKEHIFQPFINGFKKVFKINSPSKIMSDLGNFIIQGLVNGIKGIASKVKDIFVKILDSIKGVFKTIGTWFSDKFKSAFEGIKKVFASVGSFFSGIWEKIKKPFAKVVGFYKSIFSKAWEAIKKVFSGVSKFFSGVWDTIKSMFTEIGSSIGNAIGDAFKTVVNSVISFAEGNINKFIKAINGAIGLINKIPGVEITKLKEFSIPRLAKGGLATAPTLAMVGDNKNAKADPEVIAPLSKLKGMLDNGNSVEVVTLLKQILEYLQNMNLVFNGNVDKNLLFRVIAQLNKDNIKRTGVNVFG